MKLVKETLAEINRSEFREDMNAGNEKTKKKQKKTILNFKNNWNFQIIENFDQIIPVKKPKKKKK